MIVLYIVTHEKNIENNHIITRRSTSIRKFLKLNCLFSQLNVLGSGIMM